MLIDGGSNGELSHPQGHEDDGFNVSDVDLAGDVQGATCAAFHHISGRIARSRFHRDDFTGVGAHNG